MALVGSLVVSVQAQTQPFQQGMMQASTAVRQMQQVTVQAQGTISGLESSLLRLGSTYLGIQQVITSLQSLADAGKRMELLRITMNNVFGGQEAAGEALRKVSGLADQLGLSTEDLARGYTRLTAAARGSALSSQEVSTMFTQLVNISRGLGLAQEDLNGILLATQQIMSKGTIMAEEFRGQMGERLPGLMEAGAKAMGTTLAGFSKMMERGELSAKSLAIIINQMFKDVGRGAIAAGDTFDAALNRMGNAWTKFGAALMASPFGSFMKNAVASLTVALEGWERIATVAAQGRMTPTVPTESRREFVQRGAVDEISPDFQRLELLEVKRKILHDSLIRTQNLIQELGRSQDLQQRLERDVAALQKINEQYAIQEARVRALNELSGEMAARKTIETFRADLIENQTKQLEAQLKQAEAIFKQFEEIRRDTERRTEMIPSQREFFARDALADSKKLLDTLTSIVAKLREMISVLPNVSKDVQDRMKALDEGVQTIENVRDAARLTVQSFEQLEERVRRVGKIIEENQRLSMSTEAFEEASDARQRNLTQMLELTKKVFATDPEGANAMVEQMRQIALAERERIEAGHARATMEDFAKREGEQIIDRLVREDEALRSSREDWFERARAMSAANPEVLARMDAAKARLDEDKAETRLLAIRKEQVHNADEVVRSLQRQAEEAEHGTVAFENLTIAFGDNAEANRRVADASRARIAAVDFRQFEADRRLRQIESISDLLVSQRDEINALTMTSEQLLKLKLDQEGATEGQRKWALSLQESTKVATSASQVTDFLIGTFEDLVFRGQFNFSKLADSFAQMVFRIVVQSAELDKSLTKLFAKGIELGLNLLGGAAGATSAATIATTTTNVGGLPEGGGGLGFGSVVTKQFGGRFFGGEPFLAGEQGPELVVPSVPGVVLTSSQTQQAFAAAPMYVTVNIATPDVASFQQSRGAVSRAILSAITNAQRNR